MKHCRPDSIGKPGLARVNFSVADPQPVYPWPPAPSCRIHDGGGDGVVCARGARPLLQGCEIYGNAEGGVYVHEDSDPTLAGCTIRDHLGTQGNEGIGVLVAADAVGLARVLPDTIFLRNRQADVLRDDPPEAEGAAAQGDFDAPAFVAELSKIGIGAVEALAYLMQLQVAA